MVDLMKTLSKHLCAKGCEMVQKKYARMRNGISIVEMMIAVVLFGLLSTIGFKYAKNFYDISLTSKQALVSSIIEQATQVSNAYDIYETKVGEPPLDVAKLSDKDLRILTSTPARIKVLSTTGWELNNSIDIDGNGGNNDIALVYKIDAPATDIEKQMYCNVLNNIANPTWDYNASYNSTDTTDKEEINSPSGMYNKTIADFKKLMCFGTDASTMVFAFVKQINK